MYLLDCSICVAIVAQWVTGLRAFRESLKVPFMVYGGTGKNADKRYAKIVKDYSSYCYLLPGKADVGFAVDGSGVSACRQSNPLRDSVGKFGQLLHANRRAAYAAKRRQIESRMPVFKARDPLYAQSCKVLFWLFWLALVVFNAVALWPMELPIMPKIYLILLVAIATLINGASYSLCCVYVWLLNALSKMEGLEELSHNRHVPLLTPEYRKLSEASKTNTLTFLFVTVQFSATMLLDCLLLPHDEQLGIVQVLCFLTVLLVGIVTFFVLFQCSRMFLARILERWREHSLCEIQSEYEGRFGGANSAGSKTSGIVDSFQQASKYVDAYKGVETTEKMGRVDFLTLVLAALSAAMNVVTAIAFP